MKKTLAVITSLVLFSCSLDREFHVYPNGLMYSPATMASLKDMADSINVRHTQCNARRFRSMMQGFATQVEIPSAAALHEISHGVGLADYGTRYPIGPRRFVSREVIERHDGERVVFRLFKGYFRPLQSKEHLKTSGWMISEDSSSALFIDSLVSQEIPGEYSQMIQYVDCLIDTSFVARMNVDDPLRKVEPGVYVNQLFEALRRHESARPEYPRPQAEGSDYRRARKEFELSEKRWLRMKNASMDSVLENSPGLQQLLEKAVSESIRSGYFDADLERLAEKYLSEKVAVSILRNERVIGYCSQDQRPRQREREIAKRAASAGEWTIFITAHLNIMNDNFSRMSDGSYAFWRRDTYVREIERLDIHSFDLLVGSCLQTWPSRGGYSGSPSRTGRALASSRYAKQHEDRLLQMIADTRLDPFNRLVLVNIYQNYAAWLTESQEHRALERLNPLLSAMPWYTPGTH